MTQKIIFIHGWGYNPLFWKNYAKAYYGNYLCDYYNRGYFGDYHKPRLIAQSKNYCVTHSTGLFFAFKEYDMSLFDKIIIYAGFETFPNIKAARAMRLGMHHHPKKIMLDFYKNCGLVPENLEQLCFKTLKEDLKLLETYSLKEHPQWETIKYISYKGENDPILQDTTLPNTIILQNTGHLCDIDKEINTIHQFQD